MPFAKEKLAVLRRIVGRRGAQGCAALRDPMRPPLNEFSAAFHRALQMRGGENRSGRA